MNLALPLAVVALALPGASQTTWYVDAQSTPPGSGTLADPYASIAYALAQGTTVDGDTVQVAAGSYGETVDFLGKAVRVVGVGTPTIDAMGAGSVVSFVNRETRASVLENFELTGGSAAQGGGVHVFRAAPTLVKCVIRGNTADHGGGIWSSRGFPLLDECVIESNVAGDGSDNGEGGGLAVDSGRVEVVGGALVSNVAQDGGGLHLRAAGAVLAGTAIEDNEALDDSALARGGGAYVDEGSLLTLSPGSAVRGNRSRNDGGGFFVRGTLVVQDSIIEANDAGFNPKRCASGSGGGIAAEAGAAVELIATTVAANDGCFEGGGLSLPSPDQVTALLEGCLLTQNRAQFGGGLFVDGGPNDGSVLVVDSEFVENTAISVSGTSDFGGGVYGRAILEDCLLEGNWSTADGGGANGARLVRCRVIDNEVYESIPGVARGGGLFGGSAVATHFEGNRASASTFPSLGGAAFASGLTDCVLVRNEADEGGGAYSSNLDSCTLVDNLAALAGGAVFESGLVNTIARGNTPDQVAGVSTVNWSNVEGGFPGTGNFDANPLFWDPSVDDFHLAPGSPCVDAGDPNGPPDMDGSRADVGAFEFDPGYCPGPTAYCVAKTTAAGCVPSIGTLGTPSASGPDDFHLVVLDAPAGRPGLFFIGRERADVPFLGGRRCVGQFVRRPFVTSTGAGTCGGTFDDFVPQAYLAAVGFVPGTCLSAQLWFRDPMQADGTGSGLSNGVSVAVDP